MPLQYQRHFLSLLALSVMLFACTSVNSNNKVEEKKIQKKQPVQKPPSSFEDTLKINTASAVFYQPDSLQFQAIKAVTDEQVFKGSTHEYIYQTRNAHKFLKTYWPQLKIVDAKNVRFLLFEKEDNTTTLVDLNKQDSYGMYVFDLQQQPLLIDMMNVDTQVPGYFSTKN